MGLSQKQLAEGESVIMVLRTHVKALFRPILILLLLVAAVGALYWYMPDNTAVLWVALGVATVVAVIWVVLPFLRWATTDYTVTGKRVAMRTGILTRRGQDIPLYRINTVTSERDVIDRIFGCGTLVVSDASDGPGMMLYDVPRAEHVRVQLHELLFAHDDGSDDGEWPPSEPRRR